ncbi:MAG TPA: 2-amino-4-hydroxy-6-hydroxymethyldihydropteridine diphosphokinase [Cellvibrionaceae bacterium]
MPQCCYIGLGSNLDNPQQQVNRALQALAELPQTELLAHSSLYSSRAVGPVQPDYINAVAALQTELAPLLLLDHLQAIERAHQRRRTERWGPRTLDLDLLLYGDRVQDCERLTLPHPYLCQRNFVLVPLLEIAPELCLPDGRDLALLAQAAGNDGLNRLQ